MRNPETVEATCSLLVEDHDGNVLLVASPKWGDHLIVPGGHIEAGETAAQAAAREAHEELGLDVDPDMLDRLGWFEVINPGEFHRPAHFVTAVFHLWCPDRAEIHLDMDELVDTTWVPVRAAATHPRLARYCVRPLELLALNTAP